MAQTSERHHHESQLGSAAIAPPFGQDTLPPTAPALHHLGDDHTFDSQVGPSAIAPPTGDSEHPDPIPAQHHLGDEHDPTNHPPVKPFLINNDLTNNPPPPLSSRPEQDGKHTSQSQLGPSAIAAPSGIETLPPPVPALHHIKDDHTFETQLGKPAIAPPAELVENPWQDEPQKQQEKASPNDEEDNLTFPSLPPFPKDIPTAPLLRISLSKLLQQDEAEKSKVWRASKDLGFFYLDLRASPQNSSGIEGPALQKDIDALFALGERVFSLPTPEKQTYDFAAQGSYFGYKGLGAGVVDAKGTRDRNEFYNVSKDDVLGISDPLPAPEVLRRQSSRDLLAGYVRRCHAIVQLLLGVLNEKLELPEGRLQSLHRLEEVSGDQVRWVRTPARVGEGEEDEGTKALGEHTDFGSLTLLSNRLGGLQILPPSSSPTQPPQWLYIHPLPHHLIINLGDALVRFTSALLRSNIHRVVRPPGAQAGCERLSLVYFARPGDGVEMRALEGSAVVDEARRRHAGDEGDGKGEVVTAKEWILRRALGRRVGGDWEGSGGTEGGRV